LALTDFNLHLVQNLSHLSLRNSKIFSNGKDAWRVRAFSENINRASFLALVDGFEYGILISKEQGKG